MPKATSLWVDSSTTKAPPGYSSDAYPPLKEGKKLLLDIHASIYVRCAALRAIIGKAFRHSFYWPMDLANARDLIRTSKGCQYYAKQNHLPA